MGSLVEAVGAVARRVEGPAARRAALALALALALQLTQARAAARVAAGACKMGLVEPPVTVNR